MSSLKNDLTGRRFSRVLVLSRAPNKNGRVRYSCICDCGTKFETLGQHLVGGSTKSCGCLNRELASDRMKVMNHVSYDTNTRLYRTWKNMKNRVRQFHRNSKRYFERGISVCDEWQSFEPFMKWALNNGYSDGLTLDRIDNNKGYSPENCRFVDMTIQGNNKENNHYVLFRGEKLTIAEISRRYGISYGLIKDRVYRGVCGEALIEPPKSKKCYVTLFGKTVRLAEAARLTGLSYGALRNRINKGIPLELPPDEGARQRQKRAKELTSTTSGPQ